MVCAGIVTFNPSIERLRHNIEEITAQVNTVIIIDNGSDNIDAIKKIINSNENCVLIHNNENLGIAKALNQIVQKAIELQSQYVLLLDQDSIVANNLVKKLIEYSDEDVALTCPYIVDTNKTSLEEYNSLELPQTENVIYALTSGSMINIELYKILGKFDESLFIDLVDLDYSKRILIHGFKQLRVNETYLLHEVGKAEETGFVRFHKDNVGNWSLKKLYRTNHSPFRQFYMARNEIILSKKYKQYFNPWISITRGISISIARLLIEKNKFNNGKAIFKGLWNGFRYQVDEYDKEKEKHIL